MKFSTVLGVASIFVTTQAAVVAPNVAARDDAVATPTSATFPWVSEVPSVLADVFKAFNESESEINDLVQDALTYLNLPSSGNSKRDESVDSKGNQLGRTLLSVYEKHGVSADEAYVVSGAVVGALYEKKDITLQEAGDILANVIVKYNTKGLEVLVLITHLAREWTRKGLNISTTDLFNAIIADEKVLIPGASSVGPSSIPSAL
ncbi:unnamed protein product [Candida verbasci]|uniref:Uncharacterized protein n=1 Tax=Candida verbasci TaxID=1227364 RepID=A0A9W4XEN3_9ASCO|nr:unnamed protein product [Candida verbasci]